ncbi:hypothetical protein EGW08_020820 [Elysia chlorotica]|uniref:Cilia- and flagella-associated protein 97 n=1 Tax=Elysia chlorotica TaxID=188477 RepID=A0A433SQA1_ELYCH|nr:hypothetical protein EGW08_020820 [Elysia chlorotica]
MASSGGVEESLDFDFFETPRHQNEDTQIFPAAKPPKGPGPTESEEKQTAPKAIASPVKKRSVHESDSDNYSSNSASEVDQKEKDKNKNKTKCRRSSSNSSLSSTGLNSSGRQSLSKRSRSGSGSNVSKTGSSVSSDSDTERPSNPVAKIPEKALPKRGRSRMGEDDYSSSAYSEGEENSDSKSPTESYREDSDWKDSSKRTETRHKQAWGEKSVLNSKPNRKDTRARPKTAKARVSGSTHSASSGSNRKKDSSARSDSESLSDSDITDVSPMDSPRLQKGPSDTANNRAGGAKNRNSRVSSAGDGSRHKMHKFIALPVSGLDLANDGGDEGFDPPTNSRGGRGGSSLDLDILMKAVGELEKQKRVQANSRRVMFAPMGASREKNNYTFDESKTRDIERENQRLLNEIVRRVNSTADQRKQFYASPKPTYKLTPSAINRERDMKRIESENMAFLKRLQKVKPTTTICRDNQLKSYENTTLHGVSIAALHPLPGRTSRGSSDAGGGRRRSGASSVADSASSIGSRTRSMTSIHSGISSVRSSKRGSRPSSATVRPGSATKRLDSRPEWTDRW